MLAKEENKEIHFNPRDLKPNIHINWVSSVILLYALQFM